MTSQRAATGVQTLIGGVLSACRRTWLVAAVFSLGINLLMLTVPLYMLQLFDRVLMSRSMDTLLLLSVMAGLALLSLALLDMIRGYVLASHIATASQRGHFSVQSIRDLASIRAFLSGTGITPLLDAPWTPIFLVAIFILHPLL